MSYYAKRFFGQVQNDGIVTDGLKLWLDASNPASYPGSGTTWYDLSGNGNNGTMVNGVVPLSNAMSFDGVDDYVSIQRLPILSGYTTCHWIKINIQKRNSFNALSYTYEDSVGSTLFSTGFGQIVFSIGRDDTYYVSGNNEIVVGEWIKIDVVMIPSGVSRIYKNGVQLGALATPKLPTFNVGEFAFGRLVINNDYLNGQQNDIAIYNRALTPEEVLQNYNATKHKYGL